LFSGYLYEITAEINKDKGKREWPQIKKLTAEQTTHACCTREQTEPSPA